MALTASEQIAENKVRNVLVSIGTLVGGYYAFKKEKSLIGIIIFALAGGLVGGVVNKIYVNSK